jgi:hypothetical protein
MRPDAAIRIGAALHEQPYHLGPTRQDRDVQRLALVVGGLIDVHDLRACRENRPDAVEVAVADRRCQARHRDAVDERLELRPARKAVGPRDHELGIVQRERGRVRAVNVRLDLAGGRRVTAGVGLEQFLGLPLQLIEVGAGSERACGGVLTW